MISKNDYKFDFVSVYKFVKSGRIQLIVYNYKNRKQF
jgi:hypothetical protein